MDRAELETAGVPVVLQDEHTVNANWLYSNAVGGVKLMVRTEDLDKAVRVLAGRRTGEYCEVNFSISPEDDPGATRCPRCGSTQVTRERFSRWAAFLSILVLNFPFLLFRKRLRCLNCDYKWKKGEPTRRGGYSPGNPGATIPGTARKKRP